MFSNYKTLFSKNHHKSSWTIHFVKNSQFENGYYLTNEDLVVVLMGILAQAIGTVLKAILLMVHTVPTPHAKHKTKQHTILRSQLIFWQHLPFFLKGTCG